jgi:type I restriction enzyme S subunit
MCLKTWAMSYKRIGDFIELVDERNKDLSVTNLLGLSISKQFIPSVANTIGTNMKTYKIIRENQFACSVMQVRRDGKMPVALLKEFDEAIISQAYPVFQVIEETELLPEYLMMWFTRSEFDREATFHAVGGVRGSLEWEDFLNFELPIPSIEKQQQIVAEYNTVTNRINLNNQLNQNLEDTAQALYKHWFVDFEFPNTENKPYKSSGGEMVYNEELEKDIPVGWSVEQLENTIQNFISKRGKSKSLMNLQNCNNEFKYPVLSAMNIKEGRIVKYHTIPYINQSDYDSWMNPKLANDDVLLTSEAPLGETYYISIDSHIALSQRLFCLRTDKEIISGWYLNNWLQLSTVKAELDERSSGTTVSGIKLSELKKLNILIPPRMIETKFYKMSYFSGELSELKNKQSQTLKELQSLLLAKMTQVSLKTQAV